MRFFLALSLMSLMACSDGDNTDNGTDTDPDTDIDTDIDTDTPVDDIAATISGTIKNAEGTAITEGVNLQFCVGDTSCFVPTESEGGNFTIQVPEGGIALGSIKIISTPDSGYPKFFFPLTPAEGENTVDIVVPDKGTAVDLPEAAADLDIGAGIVITAGQGDIVPSGPGTEATTASAIDATEVAPALEGIDGEVLAVWYLEPFHYEADVPFTIANDWELTTGGAVLYNGDSIDSTWSSMGEVTVSEDGMTLSVDENMGEMSTLVLVRAAE